MHHITIVYSVLGGQGDHQTCSHNLPNTTLHTPLSEEKKKKGKVMYFFCQIVERRKMVIPFCRCPPSFALLFLISSPFPLSVSLSVFAIAFSSLGTPAQCALRDGCLDATNVDRTLSVLLNFSD